MSAKAMDYVLPPLSIEEREWAIDMLARDVAGSGRQLREQHLMLRFLTRMTNDRHQMRRLDSRIEQLQRELPLNPQRSTRPSGDGNGDGERKGDGQ